MDKGIPTGTRRALLAAVRQRYQAGGRDEKSRILKEFVAISGYHRKSAIRLLNGSAELAEAGGRSPRPRLYDEAVREALVILWEASDRVCGKRLRALLPLLLPALERHGHLHPEPQVRAKLLAISAASMDRLLRETRSAGVARRRRRKPSEASRAVPVRTFADWAQPVPGHLEMDLVAHGGDSPSGSFVQTLTLTDIASGWTECVALLVRESSLVIEAVEAVRGALPFAVRGLDVDNGSEFLNATVIDYCAARGVELTRSRPYHKNDQAWIEQKNGSVVRRLVGYQRLEGIAAVQTLSRLYAASRLFVNFFQPSFQLKEKVRVGARITKRYHPPMTPCARLLAADGISESVKDQLREVSEALDPLALLEQIRSMQQRLAVLAGGEYPRESTPAHEADLSRFLAGLATAWRAGEVRPTHRSPSTPVRHWRTRADPFEAVWPAITEWLESDPDQTAKAVLVRLQREYLGRFPDGLLRTLQRRVRAWRRAIAHRLVFGVHDDALHSPEEGIDGAADHSPSGVTESNNPDEAAR